MRPAPLWIFDLLGSRRYPVRIHFKDVPQQLELADAKSLIISAVERDRESWEAVDTIDNIKKRVAGATAGSDRIAVLG